MTEKRDADTRWDHLTPEQYAVTREGATEAPFSGRYHDHKVDGVYRCVCCGHELFDARTKYDSGSGWPSFWDPIARERVRLQDDRSLGMRRTEVVCAACEAHLGHVFPDGPAPTKTRYCINSAALSFRDRTNDGADAP